MPDSTLVQKPITYLPIYDVPGFGINKNVWDGYDDFQKNLLRYKAAERFRNNQDTSIIEYTNNRGADGQFEPKVIAGANTTRTNLENVPITGIGQKTLRTLEEFKNPNSSDNNFEFNFWLDACGALAQLTAAIPGLNKNPYVMGVLQTLNVALGTAKIYDKWDNPDYDWDDVLLDIGSGVADVLTNIFRINAKTGVFDAIKNVSETVSKYKDKLYKGAAFSDAAINFIGLLDDVIEPFRNEFFGGPIGKDPREIPNNFTVLGPDHDFLDRFTSAGSQIDWRSVAHHGAGIINGVAYLFTNKGQKNKEGSGNSKPKPNPDSNTGSKPGEASNPESVSTQRPGIDTEDGSHPHSEQYIGSIVAPGAAAAAALSSNDANAKESNAQIVLPDLSQSIENPGQGTKPARVAIKSKSVTPPSSNDPQTQPSPNPQPQTQPKRITGESSNNVSVYRNVPVNGSAIIRSYDGSDWLVLPNEAGGTRKFRLSGNESIEYNDKDHTVRVVPGNSNLVGGGIYNINGLSIEDRRPVPSHKSGGLIQKMQTGSTIPLKEYSLGSNESFDPTKKYDFFYTGSLDGTKPSYKWTEDGNGKWSYDPQRKQFYYDIQGEYNNVIGDEYKKLQSTFAMSNAGGLTLPALTDYAKNTGSANNSLSSDSGYTTRIYAPDILFDPNTGKYSTTPYTEAGKYSYSPVVNPDATSEDKVTANTSTPNTPTSGNTTPSANTTTSTTGGSSEGNAAGGVFSGKESDERAKSLSDFLSAHKMGDLKEGNYSAMDNVVSPILNTANAVTNAIYANEQWQRQNFKKRRINVPDQQTEYSGNYFGLNEAYNTSRNINQQAYLYDGIKDDSNAQLGLKSAIQAKSGELAALGQDAAARQQSKMNAMQTNAQNAAKNAAFRQGVADDQYEMKHDQAMMENERNVRIGEALFNLPLDIANNLKKEHDERIAMYGNRMVSNAVAMMNSEKNKANSALKYAMADANQNIIENIDRNWKPVNDYYTLTRYLDSHPYYDHNGVMKSADWTSALKNAFDTAESWNGIDLSVMAARKIYSDYDDVKGNARKDIVPRSWSRNDDNGRRGVTKRDK